MQVQFVKPFRVLRRLSLRQQLGVSGMGVSLHVFIHQLNYY